MAEPGDWPLVRFKLPQSDLDYIDRRAEPLHGNRSEALRRIIRDSRTLRHDLKGKLNALELIERCLAGHAATFADAVPWIRQLKEDMQKMVDDAADAA